jgi:hypothetical protein
VASGSSALALNLNPDKTFTFDLPIPINSPNGVNIQFTLTFSVTDNHGGADSRSINTTIQNVAPEITSLDGPTTGVRGQSLHYTGSFTDSDPDTWTIYVNFGDGSGTQTLTPHPDKTFAFDHPFTVLGTHPVQVTIGDNHGGFSTRILDVTIENVVPVITSLDGPTQVVRGEFMHYTGVFDDPDPDTWTGDVVVSFSGQTIGTLPVTINSDKTFAFDSFASAAGNVHFRVEVFDNHGGVGIRELDVTIVENSPPVAKDDIATLNTAISVTINVLANDSDPDGDVLTVTAVTQPASGHGTVTINANGTLTYKQTVFVNGTETFTYTVSDGYGGTATATVTVTVNLPATVGIDMLLDQIRSSRLSRGHQTSVIAKLNAAQHSLARGNARAAANQLTAFTNEIRAFKRNHTLAPDQADLWLFEVNNILATMPRAAITNQQMTRSIRTR